MEVGRYRRDERAWRLTTRARPDTQRRGQHRGKRPGRSRQKLSSRPDVQGCAADMMAAYAYGLSEGQPAA